MPPPRLSRPASPDSRSSPPSELPPSPSSVSFSLPPSSVSDRRHRLGDRRRHRRTAGRGRGRRRGNRRHPRLPGRRRRCRRSACQLSPSIPPEGDQRKVAGEITRVGDGLARQGRGGERRRRARKHVVVAAAAEASVSKPLPASIVSLPSSPPGGVCRCHLSRKLVAGAAGKRVVPTSPTGGYPATAGYDEKVVAVAADQQVGGGAEFAQGIVAVAADQQVAGGVVVTTASLPVPPMKPSK